MKNEIRIWKLGFKACQLAASEWVLTICSCQIGSGIEVGIER